MTARQALGALIAVSSGLRLAWAAALGPGHDEAYHYLYTVHPAWSYFDHPPMLAWVEFVGLVLAGGAASAFALRLGFIALFAGSTWLMARLTARFYGPWAGVLAAFILNVSAYFTAAVGTFALPDGPLVFFWLLTLERLATALDAGTSRPLRAWLVVGLAWGGAMLSKYHAVFLPAGMLIYLLWDPSARVWLRRLGPYLALGVGLLLFAPVVWWNLHNDWASFAFQGGRAWGGLTFRPDALASAVGGQALYLFPWIWLALVGTLVRRIRRLWRGGPAPEAAVAIGSADRFLLAQSLLPLTVFLAVSCFRPILPHWTLVGYLSVMPMLGQTLAARMAANPARVRRRLVLLAVLPVAIAWLATEQTQSGLFQSEGHSWLAVLPPEKDPTVDLYGWDQIADELRQRGLLNRSRTFLFTDRWFHSGQIALAIRDQAPVLCYNSRKAQGFVYWSQPEDWLGFDGILVAIDDNPADPYVYRPYFEQVEPIGAFAIVRAGVPVRQVRLFHYRNQVRPFPFDNLARPTSARPREPMTQHIKLRRLAGTMTRSRNAQK